MTTTTIQPFIDLGWQTVPLRGRITRRKDGTKTEPTFPKDWKNKYKHTTNTIGALLGGVLTGTNSNLLAIDCDNTITYDIFKALDPDYEFIFRSKGKGTKVCGTLLYMHSQEVSTFSLRDQNIDLDVYAEGGFVYLATPANESKHAIQIPLPTLKPAPPQTLALLAQLAKKTPPSTTATTHNIVTANCLAPLVGQFVQHRKFLPGLFKIITPKDFRHEQQYVQKGYLHPENVPDGRGSEYLSKLSAILGSDVSIDEELYISAMHDINNLFATPMDSDRLDSTITDSMVSGKASIEGVPLWKYDEDWQAYRLVLQTKRQSTVELGFDDYRNTYYCVDAASQQIKGFAKDNDLIAYVEALTVAPPKKVAIKAALPIINVIQAPNKTFGFHEGTDPTARDLNTFVQTPELAIINDPATYASQYKRPDTTLAFLEHLVPEKVMYTYLLQFLKKKLETFSYSPVMLYFLGVPGSGKDTFVALLEKIMGHVARPTSQEFLEKYNAWMLDTYFVQLDEYGDQLTTIRDKEEALGKLKAYTGKQVVQIRQMRTDGFQYRHNATFISTANKNPFGLEEKDRRIALFNTPEALIDASWVEDVTEVHAQILKESKDFAYYLATEVGKIDNTLYMKPPETENKRILIADSMYASHKLAYAMKYKMFDYLRDIAITYSCDAMVQAIAHKRIYSTELEDLYEVMTDYKGDSRSLNKAVRGIGISVKPTTINQKKRYYYDIYPDSPFDSD